MLSTDPVSPRPLSAPYTRDHLGSVREVTDSNGVLQARYDYDSWGNKTVLSGNMTVDFGYAGYYYHAPSGLNLTLNRGYNPYIGRWLSRDPIGEQAGLNLYAYVGNEPVRNLDPFGLDAYIRSANGSVVRVGTADGSQIFRRGFGRIYYEYRVLRWTRPF